MVNRMNALKSLLAISILGLVVLSATGCSGRPVSASQAYAAADELDPANKATATDPRNKMAAHGIR
jgi:hypothetical protein